MSAMVYSSPEIAPVVEPVVQHAVEAVGLIGETANRIGLVAFPVAEAPEMAAFAELGSLVGHLPHDPLRDFVFPVKVLGPELPSLLGDVHHDRARFEN